MEECVIEGLWGKFERMLKLSEFFRENRDDLVSKGVEFLFCFVILGEFFGNAAIR